MTNILSVVLGAAISLITTMINNRSSYVISKNREEQTNKRLNSEWKKKSELLEQEFQNKVTLDNRSVMPTAGKEIIVALNELYDCTEKLVINYPGTSQTGEYPELLFKDTISHLGIGFPSSLSILLEVDQDWIKSSKAFNNITTENNIY